MHIEIALWKYNHKYYFVRDFFLIIIFINEYIDRDDEQYLNGWILYLLNKKKVKNLPLRVEIIDRNSGIRPRSGLSHEDKYSIDSYISRF